MPLRRFLVFTALVGAAGCSAPELPRPVYSSQSSDALVAIPTEPPPGRAERIPPQPPGSVVWVDGEWSPRRRRWAWTPGRWVAPPPGVTYSPWCTVRGADGTLYFAPAVWRDAKGAVVPAPRAIVWASVEAGVVVDPEGNAERTVVGAPR